ncbi:hypothetical protein MUK51_07405 [Sphingobacterium faecium]|jgi:hypothetical protein|uniref:hypothetical protein n=1 Tax=Sphingobacterium faecium TaxID=34087 RepID=UPI0004E5FE12|nr:hypothetical protein [Sphingobacterium faecium]UXD71109.1 hypothetical protein MUK51_07405 [Sphingobacterium faecium]CDT22496.1 hypothetical protein BN1088_1910004 [Sphingobacterium sp. PM2-P1-29]
MDRIANLFKDRILKRGGLNLYSKEDTLKFIDECEKDTVSILGIDGFYITENSTQPSLANSVDLSGFSMENENIYDLVKSFVAERPGNLFFEIIYEERQ